MPYRDIDHVGPAGSILSSAADMARWLRLLLAGGAWDGEPLIEAATLAETTTSQMVVPPDPVMAAFHPVARLQTYGMGWFISDFHGMTLLAHGGGIDGMSALAAWVPEAELGVAILTNLQAPTPPTWIFGMLYGLLDAALGVEPTHPACGAVESRAQRRPRNESALDRRLRGCFRKRVSATPRSPRLRRPHPDRP